MRSTRVELTRLDQANLAVAIQSEAGFIRPRRARGLGHPGTAINNVLDDRHGD